jgi:hypothetical protein
MARAAAEQDDEHEDAAAGGDVRCSGTTAAGEPCGMVRLKGSLICRHHDPDLRASDDAARQERRRQQEAARRDREYVRLREAWAAQLETPEQLRAFVAQVTRAAWDRRIGPEDARGGLDGARLLARLLGREEAGRG